MRRVARFGAVLALLLGGVGGCSKPSSQGSSAEAPAPRPPAAKAAEAGAGHAAGASAAEGNAARAAPSRPRNVVFLSIDSLRADMPWAAYERPIAPRLSALYAKSVAYTRAYATSSFTSKSVPGMLTGKLPSELTRTGRFFTRYLDDKEFMCPALDAQGIACLGAHAHAYFGKGQAGFDRGFRDWRIVDGITFDYQKDPYVTSDKLTPLAIRVLEKPSEPFFAWFHYMDPHDEYQGHEQSPHFGKKARDRYDEEVFYTDLYIGKLLDFVAAQPWAERTAIVVTADHGEAFGEHNMTRHAHELWEELVHVPMFFYVPGAKPRTIDVRRSHLDLVPTFVDLLGAEAIDGLRGKSLVPELQGAKAAPRDVVMDLPEDNINERRRALIHDKWKIIAFGNDVRFQLFDLDADPKEADDRMRKDLDAAEDMKRRYKEASKEIRDVAPRGGIPKREK